MNAKELRQAAELATEWDGYIHHENKPAFAAWKLLANHILATVREDDDEPFDPDWFASHADEKQRVPIGDGRFIERDRFGSVFIDIDGSHCDFPLKTRGDFRTLCRLLGVKLREPA